MPTEASRKRAYQPTIAAFFPSAHSGFSLTEPKHNQPQLPTHVQSSLLNVGMRVRRAVPGGYQNGKTDVTFGATSGRENTGIKRRTRGGTVTARPRELVGYAWGYDAVAENEEISGLHEVGGMGVQASEIMRVNMIDEEDLDDFPASTQDSASSIDSVRFPLACTKKRVLEDPDNEESGEIHGVGEREVQAWIHARPRARCARRLATRQQLVQREDGDFEDASFLRAREEVMDLT